ncbi:MAG: hypothetical protein GF317_10795 [Candidatus Lokiarchaeota archaeon]|nr:hypothetical protein [Candidatus Lokiarchaeota archaeon]MBD3200149.1 hypothetical protein [Candidatus Lokiarchaeota archaeon]
MEAINTILGIFYSDKDNLVYEKIDYSKELGNQKKQNIKMLPFKFLGPVFLTAASEESNNWRIEFIEASLSLNQEKIMDRDVIQSFFNLNSSMSTNDGMTNLFTIIGSPYTEDVDSLFKKLDKYIHPSINQGRIVKESMLGNDFKFKDFIIHELARGMEMINHSLGSSRKVYWKEQQKYYCIGVIERINIQKKQETFLYPIKNKPALLRDISRLIPSYYVMSILPNYYENLINETLKLFDKTNVYPNIRQIKLRNEHMEVIYLEEFLKNDKSKRSYGVILIPEIKKYKNGRNLSYYKKQLRMILDANKPVHEIITSTNHNLDVESWGANTEEELNAIKRTLDFN